MSAVYGSSYANEGFCWDADCTPFIGRGEGTCMAKKTIGEGCMNGGGNYDNNLCVTQLCSDTSGVCEVRTSGCASLGACLDMGLAVATSLAEYSAAAYGSTLVEIVNMVCPEDLSQCQGSASLFPDEARFEVSFSETAFDDLLFANGVMYVEVPLDIDMTADLVTPDISIFIPNVEFGFDVVFGLDFEASASKEYTKDFVLTDGLGICQDPFNERKSCNPHIIFSRVIKMKYATIDIEVGFQIVGSLTATVEASSELLAQFNISKNIVVPKLGARVTSSGLTLLGLDEVWDIVNSNLLDHVDFTVDGEASVKADFNMNVSPQLYVLINGIEFQGGIDFVFAAGAEFKADTESGCASGGATMSFGMLMDFYSPPFDIYEGTKAACTSIIGMAQAQELFDTVQDVQSNAYGTHCAVQYLGACDDRFDLCDEAATFTSDLMSNMVGSTMAISDIYVCNELFSVSLELSSGIMVNGDSCEETAELSAVICPEEHHAYSGNDDYCGVNGTANVAPQAALLFSLILSGLFVQ